MWNMYHHYSQVTVETSWKALLPFLKEILDQRHSLYAVGIKPEGDSGLFYAEEIKEGKEDSSTLFSNTIHRARELNL